MNDETKSQIEQYLLDELSKPEREVFEKQLHENPTFAEAVAKQRLIIQAIQNTKALEVQNKIVQLLKARRDAKAVRKPFSKKLNLAFFLYTMLVIGLTLIAFWYFFLKNKPNSAPNDLYAYAISESYPVYPSVLFPEAFSVRSSGVLVADSTQLNAINEYYSNGNYADALTALRQLSKGTVKPDVLYYYEGVLLLKLNNPQEANRAFNKVKENPYAEWNHAIVLLALGDLQKAKRIFQKIQQSKPSLRSKASILIDKIDFLEKE